MISGKSLNLHGRLMNGPSMKTSMCSPPEPVNTSPSWQKGLAKVTKLRVLGYPRPNGISGDLVKKRESEGRETDDEDGGRAMAGEWGRPLQAGKGKRPVSPLEPPKGTNPNDTDFRTSGLQN